MFRIKASYKDQLELKTTIARAREFFGELRNFVDLMPGIEGIRRDAEGIMRWIVRAEVPVIGSVHASFAVEKTEDEPDRLEWSPVPGEMKNYLRYAAAFEERGQKVLIRIAQHVELRRPHAKDLHLLAGLIGEGAISSEMQKRVGEMIRTFLERARVKLESLEADTSRDEPEPLLGS
jgi:carbon monoxide dehydrogenase subunit G